MEVKTPRIILNEMSEVLKAVKEVVTNQINNHPEKDKIQGTLMIALLNSIYNGIIGTLDDESYQNEFTIVYNNLGEVTASSLLNMMISGNIVAATNAASTVADEIFKVMDSLSSTVEGHLTNVSADLSAVKDSVVVLRKRLEEITKSSIVNQLSK